MWGHLSEAWARTSTINIKQNDKEKNQCNMSWSCLKCCCRTLKELCIDECLHTSMTWSKGRVIQNPSTTKWQTNSVTEKATVSIICFWGGLNNMLLSFSSYIYLILRSGKDKVLLLLLFYAINKVTFMSVFLCFHAMIRLQKIRLISNRWETFQIWTCWQNQQRHEYQ